MINKIFEKYAILNDIIAYMIVRNRTSKVKKTPLIFRSYYRFLETITKLLKFMIIERLQFTLQTISFSVQWNRFVSLFNARVHLREFD